MFHIKILNLVLCPCAAPRNDFWSSWSAVMKFIMNLMYRQETSGPITVLLIITGVTYVYAEVVGGKLCWKIRCPLKFCMDGDNCTTETGYDHPIRYTVYPHTYCSSSFSLLITNMTGGGHILRSRNLRCWKQRIQMPHRVVRSLIHSSWCHAVDCSVRPYSFSPRTCKLRCSVTFTQSIWNTARFVWLFGDGLRSGNLQHAC